MARAEDKKNLQGDIPKSLHHELVCWCADHKKNSLRQCMQAAVELWVKTPDPIKALTLICDRDLPLFERIASEIADRLAPVADLFIDEKAIDARAEFEEIREMVMDLRTIAYTHLTGFQGEILDRIKREFDQLDGHLTEGANLRRQSADPSMPGGSEASAGSMISEVLAEGGTVKKPRKDRRTRSGRD
jgi:hypothetical protein